MFIENCSNNTQEKNMDAKLGQLFTKMNVGVLVKNLVQYSYSLRERVSVVRDFPPLYGFDALSLN